MIVVRAELSDLPRLIKFRSDAATWLRQQGSDQWSNPFPTELLIRSIQKGDVYLVKGAREANAVATITLDQEAEPALWTPTEIAEPALYVHKLTVDRDHAGLGKHILAWAGNLAAQQGMRWLRIDAWTANQRLHRYYTDLGFQHLRTVRTPETHGSGWVAQLPAGRHKHPSVALNPLEAIEQPRTS